MASRGMLWAAAATAAGACEEVAERTVEGLEDDAFYIVTHPHAVEIARERWEDVEQAFAEQAPHYDGDEKYDLAPIMKQLVQSDGEG